MIGDGVDEMISDGVVISDGVGRYDSDGVGEV